MFLFLFLYTVYGLLKKEKGNGKLRLWIPTYIDLTWPRGVPPLHRGCDLSASIVRPQNWPGRRWRQRGGRTVALVAQCYTGRSDIAMDAMVAVKFWACSKQSHKGRQGDRSLTGRSKEAGGRHTHRHGGRMDAQWSAIGRPVKNTYCCEHCVSIWATFLPPLYHHCASFGRPIASIERSQWRLLCLHSATTATLLPRWQWFCLHSASFARPAAPLQQIWSFREGTRVVLQQLHRNRTFKVWATTERPGHFSGRSKVVRRSQPCVKGVNKRHTCNQPVTALKIWDPFYQYCLN